MHLLRLASASIRQTCTPDSMNCSCDIPQRGFDKVPTLLNLLWHMLCASLMAVLNGSRASLAEGEREICSDLPCESASQATSFQPTHRSDPAHAGEDAIKHLLSRGTHREFGYAALVTMLVVYFLGAVWAAGSAIASGLFVPMLLIGSCIGRIVGLICVDIAASGGHGSSG